MLNRRRGGPVRDVLSESQNLDPSRRETLTRTISATLVLIAAVATGCGGSSEPSETAGKPSASSAPSSETYESAADQAIGRKALLVLDDFFSGWVAKSSDSDEDKAGS